jgi:hypothetical protein
MNQPKRKWRVKIRRDYGRQEELGIAEAAYHGEATKSPSNSSTYQESKWSGCSCGIFAVPERIRLPVAVGHASIAATAIHNNLARNLLGSSTSRGADVPQGP